MGQLEPISLYDIGIKEEKVEIKGSVLVALQLWVANSPEFLLCFQEEVKERLWR
jgi:hypothetical protein